MAFTSNIRAFRGLPKSDLVESYLLLIAFELACKDGNCLGSKSGHDVPRMLQEVANLPGVANKGVVRAQLMSFSAQLSKDLGLITCQGKAGTPQQVPPSNYPYIRYCRHLGDWGGVSETHNYRITALLNTCKNIQTFLSSHAAIIGIKL
jgi:hypothetical protein